MEQAWEEDRINHAESSGPEVAELTMQSLVVQRWAELTMQSLVVQVGRINHAESSSPGGQNTMQSLVVQRWAELTCRV